MNQTLENALTVALSQLSRIMDAPVASFGYGKDLSCVQDCTEDFREVDAFSRETISQALIRRLTTPRGSLIDDQNYGFDLRGMLNRGLSAQDLRTSQASIEQECLKDERVNSCVATVLQPSLSRLEISIRVVPATVAQTFDLVFALTDAGVLLERIAA